MSTTNDQLLKRVFQEMLIYKPALQRMLVADDDAEEEILDGRLMGDIIIRNFPWPIGIELRRLFSASMHHPDRMRLDQIFKTIERTMQFICFVLICQIWKAKKESGLKIPEPLAKDFQSRMAVLTMGNYSWLIRTIGSLISGSRKGMKLVIIRLI